MSASVHGLRKDLSDGIEKFNTSVAAEMIDANNRIAELQATVDPAIGSKAAPAIAALIAATGTLVKVIDTALDDFNRKHRLDDIDVDVLPDSKRPKLAAHDKDSEHWDDVFKMIHFISGEPIVNSDAPQDGSKLGKDTDIVDGAQFLSSASPVAGPVGTPEPDESSGELYGITGEVVVPEEVDTADEDEEYPDEEEERLDVPSAPVVADIDGQSGSAPGDSPDRYMTRSHLFDILSCFADPTFKTFNDVVYGGQWRGDNAFLLKQLSDFKTVIDPNPTPETDESIIITSISLRVDDGCNKCCVMYMDGHDDMLCADDFYKEDGTPLYALDGVYAEHSTQP